MQQVSEHPGPWGGRQKMAGETELAELLQFPALFWDSAVSL